MTSPYDHSLITLAIGLSDRIIIATDASDDEPGTPSPHGIRAVELRPGFVVAASGVWKSRDGMIDTPRDIRAAFREDDTATAFLQRYDRLRRHAIEQHLTQRYREEPSVVVRECFCPLNPPHSLVVCEVDERERRATVLEYIPTLTSEDNILLTPMIQAQEPADRTAFGAIGAAAPALHFVDHGYIDHAMRGPAGAEQIACTLITDALQRAPGSAQLPTVVSFAVPPVRSRSRASRASRTQTLPRRGFAATAAQLPPVDTTNAAAVEEFVSAQFAQLYPATRMTFAAQVFRDVEAAFAGRDPAYAPIDVRYHNLEHTLQATVCATLILAGRQTARVSPRIDARHFELAIIASLLHDSGYLKGRTDTRGTGAKYTFCHVLRSSAFAATYLPTIGATASDIQTVMNGINCTGRNNEVGRLRFREPIDEIIGSIVATADYLGQMAAPDYPDKLEFLFEEFQESDAFIHLPPEDRMFSSATELLERTPQFWSRYVLPLLESDFQGVYRFLARPFPHGSNPYLQAIEANIAEIERRLRESARQSLPSASTSSVAPFSPTPSA